MKASEWAVVWAWSLENRRGVITKEAGTFGETDRRQLCESLQSFTSMLRQAWRVSVESGINR